MTIVKERPLLQRLPKPSSTTLRKGLLVCGIGGSALYVTTDIIGTLLYEGYSYTDNTWSELFAIGAPTRALIVPYSIGAILLGAAFAVGLWTSATPKRTAARITGAMLLGSSAVGIAAQAFFPMLTREASAAGEGTLRNALHPPVSAVSGIFLLMAVGFGAVLLRRRFRWYSVGTIVTIASFAVLAGQQGGRPEANLPTPWIGFEERVSAYAFALWVAVLAIGLLRAQVKRGRHDLDGRRAAG